ncbi:efflux RND transporter periplasmic adaptor subunit [Nitrospirillum viridazoti]|uniref:Uncharacterized protein n=1 Tax=Nitrospirillum viridazoti CBAmc TaxID=1441467 RepID=A0A248JZ80_9PROT|nr:efflux RND transporter periplasmic adaptor subunit [Nitrospirillum amazonense]ASG24043.1 hypothetical protein Y958_24255 [Nitrospirillum amazonense CBAmc]TWB40975.1 RND family efflux transporter MFP subunit [Nitrospirillum amazonense]
MSHPPLPRFTGPALLAFTLLAGIAHAQAPQQGNPAALPLTDAQAKAAGVETRAPQPAPDVASPTYPARLDVFEHYKTVVAAPVPGIVDELVGEVNDAVVKGALLARMRSPEMAQAQRDYLLALDAAALAQREAQRDADLVAEGIIAERRQQASRSTAVQADAQLQERRQALLALGLTTAEVETLKRSRRVTDEMAIRAPEGGMILDHGAFPGQRIDSSVPLYTLARLSSLLLEVQVPAAVAATLHEKDKVRLADAPEAAAVESIGHHADPASQTVTVRVLVDNRAGRLRPGLMTAASFLSTGVGTAWALPHDAVVRVAGRPTVFVRRGDKVEAASISVLSETADTVVAQGPGLAADSAVVVRGTVVLKGMQAGLGGQE